VTHARNLRNTALGLAAAGLLAACAELTETHGYAPTPGDLSYIEVGRDTRATVESILGRPSATGVIDERGWFYVKSEFRTYGWREPEEISRSVVAILFDETGTVSNIETLGIRDGEIVALSRRVTETTSSEVGFLQQLFGNVGVFDPASALGGE